MNGLRVAVLLLVGQRYVDHFAGFAEAHRAGELCLEFLLDGIVPDEGRCIVARHVESVVETLVAPDVAGVQDRLGDIEQPCRLVGMGSHPDRAADLAAVLVRESGDQIVVVELVGDGREDLRAARGCQTQYAQCLALGRVSLIFAQMSDVFDQGEGERSSIL